MEFAKAMREETKWTETENGARVKNTTDSALLDVFAGMGAMRNRSDEDLISKFEAAYAEDPLGAVRCLFYLRDCRGGQGERRIFRVLLPYIAQYYPEAIKRNIGLISEYGRWDDLYSLVDTPLEDLMWRIVKLQLTADRDAMEQGKPCSLLAKWLKKADASSPNTKKLGIYTANKLDMSVYDYKRLCNKLRKWIDVVECKMSANKWSDINYPGVPSRAMMNYRDAFKRHDEERFGEYINKVNSGEEKINSSVLYPYDIVEKILYHKNNADEDVLETQWKNLPDYVEKGSNVVVMADVSGSMYGRPMATSVGLALYFAERNEGAYHNLFMTFSGQPDFVEIEGKTLREKIRSISTAHWEMDTNLERAMLKILEVAKENNCSQEEMPESLIVISDMEINYCCCQKHGENFYDYIERKYSEVGYKVPNIVFWNVDSRHDIFLADTKHKGVQLVSGQSASTFKNLIGCIGMSPVEMMYKVLNGERYSKILLEDNLNK